MLKKNSRKILEKITVDRKIIDYLIYECKLIIMTNYIAIKTSNYSPKTKINETI